MPRGFEKQFGADFKKRFTPLNVRLRTIEDKIYKLIINSIGSAKMGGAYWNSVKRELDTLYRQMNVEFNKWAKKELPARYKRSLAQLQTRINAQKNVLNKAKKSFTELLTSNASTQIMRGLYDSSVESFLASSLTGRKNLRNLFITTQQTLVSESLVNVAVATGFEMGDLREAKKLLTAIFESPEWEAIGKKQFVQAGKMKYRPHKYAELVARTKFHQAHTQAALVQAANYATDLMEVSTHNTTTAICMPFEGKVFSISGNDPRFPPLTDSPPYHPNCLHLMFPTFESAMIVQGTLDKFSEFSLGETDRPPNVSSFIPIKDRGVA